MEQENFQDANLLQQQQQQQPQNKWSDFNQNLNLKTIRLEKHSEQNQIEFSVDIEVRCPYRAEYYKKNLQRALEIFIAFEDTGSLSLSKKQICQDLLKHLASILDEQIVDCLDKEFKANASYQKINDISQARQEYEKYFQSENNNPENFSKRHQELFDTNKIVTDNFIRTRLMAIQRVYNDFELLRKIFLTNLQDGIRLIKISSSGSDMHKQGQQVLILTFEDSNGNKKRVVYKPSPVEADAMLVGDVLQLGEIYDKYKNHFSLIELLNEKLDDKQKLPKYLIVPRNDRRKTRADNSNNNDNDDESRRKRKSEITTTKSMAIQESDFHENKIDLDAHYGYIEFLSHEPWADFDCIDIIEDTLRQLPLNKRDGTDSIQHKITEEYKTFLRQAARNNKECDFITSDLKDIDRYSFDCGLLLSLMVVSGIIDSHCQNLIICQRRPMIIDAEVCLAQKEPTIGNKLCFSFQDGSMSRYSVITEEHYCLIDVKGRYELRVDHIEKNRFFQLYLETNGRLEACAPIPELVQQGFQKGLEIFKLLEKNLNEWFELSCVKNMLIRVPVYGSNVFKDDLIKLKDNNFSQEIYDTTREASLKTKNKTLPFSAIYLNNNHETDILSEYRSLNIPVFYAISSECYLFNAYGEIILIPTDENLMITHNQFFKQSCLAYTEGMAFQVIAHPGNVIQDLIENSKLPNSKSSEMEYQCLTVDLATNPSTKATTQSTLESEDNDEDKTSLDSPNSPLLSNKPPSIDKENNNDNSRGCGGCTIV